MRPNERGPDPTPVLFYSRRIGFTPEGPVPIQGGGRLIGRAGPASMGILNIQAGEGDGGTPRTNFTVARVKSDLSVGNRVGALATYRRPSSGGGGSNLAWGADADLALARNLWLSGYYARTRTPTGSGGESYLARTQYDADRYGLRLERLKVGAAFDPGVGLLRWSGFVRSLVQGRVSRRPKSLALVRRIGLDAGFDHYANEAGALETRQGRVRLRVDFQNSDVVSVAYSRNLESLREPFVVARGRLVQPGRYRFHEVSASLEAGSHRR